MIGYIITASACTCVGFLMGAIISHAKVNYLIDRLSFAERDLSHQSMIVKELTKALRDMLGNIENQLPQSAVSFDTSVVRDALANCDKMVADKSAAPVSAI